ncbi:MAG: hypothetical protein HYZ28_27295 [Myxococcales bacterium]|nr:hypothetical protein [Myxococcales bacterium]
MSVKPLLDSTSPYSSTASDPEEPATSAARGRRQPPGHHASPMTERAARGEAFRPPEEAMDSIRKALQYGVLDWKVTDRDVGAVHSALASLSPKDYRSAMEEMNRRELLDRYVGRLDRPARDQLLSQAESKGFIVPSGEVQPSGSLQPPATPSVYVNDAELPPAIRSAIHRHALDAAGAYCRQYEAYLDRYAAAAGQAASGSDIRELGPLVPPQTPAQLGLREGHPDFGRFSRDWLSAMDYPNAARAQEAVSRRLAELRGERPPGSVWIESFAAVEAGDAWVKSTGTIGGGEPRGKFSAGRVWRSGPFHASTERDSDGRVTRTVGATGRFGGTVATLELEDQRKVRATLSTPVSEVKADTSGRVDLTLSARRNLKATAHVSPREGEFGGASQGTLDVGPIKGTARLGLGAQGLSLEGARHALDPHNPGPFELPEELQARVQWWDLSTEARARHARNGWTAEEWTRRLPPVD